MEGAMRPFPAPGRELAVVRQVGSETIARVINDSSQELAGLANLVDESYKIAFDTLTVRNQFGHDFNNWSKHMYERFGDLDSAIKSTDVEIETCRINISELQVTVESYENRLTKNQKKIDTVETFLDGCRAYLPSARERAQTTKKQLELLDDDMTLISKWLSTGLDDNGQPVDYNLLNHQYEQSRQERVGLLQEKQSAETDFTKTSVEQVEAQLDLDKLHEAIRKIAQENSATHKEIVELTSKLRDLRRLRTQLQTEFDRVAIRIRNLGDLFDQPDEVEDEENDIIDAEEVPETTVARGGLALAAPRRTA